MNVDILGLNSSHWPKQSLLIWIILGLALIVGIGSLAGGIYIEISRVGAVLALLLLVLFELRDGHKRFLTSPLFLLSTIGILFFSVAQGIWAPEPPWPDTTRNFSLYVGSQAEAIILVFCMVGLVFYQFTSGIVAPSKSPEITELPNYVIFGLFMLALSISIFDVVLYYLKADMPPIYAKVHFVVPALLILSLILLIRNSVGRGGYYKIGLFLFSIFVLGGLVYVGESKIVVFIMTSLLLYSFRIFSFSFRHLILVLLASVLVVLALIQVIQQTRWKVSGSMQSEQISTNYSRIFQGKGVWRQLETGYCLGNVVKSHANQPFDASKQNFWIIGLVPRVLWPDKPSLSLGKVYAVKYCSKLPHLVGHHSSSITVLGQPLIHGGIFGLIIHAGLLLFALAGIEKLNANRSALSTCLVVALLPWLIDFDQDFAMYLANAVKFALVMLILFIPIVLIERRDINGHLA